MTASPAISECRELGPGHPRLCGDHQPEDVPNVNTAPFGSCPPGTVAIGKVERNRDGSWTIPLAYRAEGWKGEPKVKA